MTTQKQKVEKKGTKRSFKDIGKKMKELVEENKENNYKKTMEALKFHRYITTPSDPSSWLRKY